MSKKVKVILDILIVLAAIFCFAACISMISAYKFAQKRDIDEAESDKRVFAYRVEKKAYGKIVSEYYLDRCNSPLPPEGREDLHHVAAYAHAAFMDRVYQTKGDEKKIAESNETLRQCRAELGDYSYTADEVDEMLDLRMSLNR
jgi:hypothetical protein